MSMMMMVMMMMIMEYWRFSDKGVVLSLAICVYVVHYARLLTAGDDFTASVLADVFIRA